MRRMLFFSAILGGGAVVVAFFLLFSVFAVPTQNYAISIDPIKQNQYLFSTARVMVTNNAL
jgi:hypothetical protein